MLPSHFGLNFILTLEGELVAHGDGGTQQGRRRRGWQGEDHRTSCKIKERLQEVNLITLHYESK